MYHVPEEADSTAGPESQEAPGEDIPPAVDGQGESAHAPVASEAIARERFPIPMEVGFTKKEELRLRVDFRLHNNADSSVAMLRSTKIDYRLFWSAPTAVDRGLYSKVVRGTATSQEQHEEQLAVQGRKGLQQKEFLK